MEHFSFWSVLMVLMGMDLNTIKISTKASLVVNKVVFLEVNPEYT
jgi:hypothetical protein